MTLTPINPSNITAIPISGFPGTGIPYTNITPFTYRDGLTYIEVLEGLRGWLKDTLVPWINDSVGSLENSWHTEVDALVAAVNAALDAQATTVNGALATQSTEVNAALAALQTEVNTTVAQIIENSLSANDGLVRTLVNNTASLTRVALDAVYQAKGTVDDAAVAALLASATGTRGALDTRYQAAGVTFDVAHGGTGRATSAPAFGLLAAGSTPTGAQQTVSPGLAGQFLISGGVDALPQFGTLIDDVTADIARVYSSTKVEALVASKSLYGLYSARPAVATVKPGTIYACSDTLELFIASGGVWRVTGSGGNTVVSGRTLTDFTNNGTVNNTAAIIPGLNLSFTAGERPLTVRFSATIGHSNGGGTFGGSIFFDGAEIAGFGGVMPGTGAGTFYRDSSREVDLGVLTPGTTHTVSARAWAASAGTVSVFGSSSAPALLKVVTQ